MSPLRLQWQSISIENELEPLVSLSHVYVTASNPGVTMSLRRRPTVLYPSRASFRLTVKKRAQMLALTDLSR